jgi:hypothetical protein
MNTAQYISTSPKEPQGLGRSATMHQGFYVKRNRIERTFAFG